MVESIPPINTISFNSGGSKAFRRGAHRKVVGGTKWVFHAERAKKMGSSRTDPNYREIAQVSGVATENSGKG